MQMILECMQEVLGTELGELSIVQLVEPSAQHAQALTARLRVSSCVLCRMLAGGALYDCEAARLNQQCSSSLKCEGSGSACQNEAGKPCKTSVYLLAEGFIGGRRVLSALAVWLMTVDHLPVRY